MEMEGWFAKQVDTLMTGTAERFSKMRLQWDFALPAPKKDDIEILLVDARLVEHYASLLVATAEQWRIWGEFKDPQCVSRALEYRIPEPRDSKMDHTGPKSPGNSPESAALPVDEMDGE